LNYELHITVLDYKQNIIMDTQSN